VHTLSGWATGRTTAVPLLRIGQKYVKIEQRSQEGQKVSIRLGKFEIMDTN